MQKVNSSLQIDIYGACGPLTLDKPGELSTINYFYNFLESYEELSKNYKFYLSFENSLCQEYITEKFFNAMKSGMIPIAYGGLR